MGGSWQGYYIDTLCILGNNSFSSNIYENHHSQVWLLRVQMNQQQQQQLQENEFIYELYNNEALLPSESQRANSTFREFFCLLIFSWDIFNYSPEQTPGQTPATRWDHPLYYETLENIEERHSCGGSETYIWIIILHYLLETLIIVIKSWSISVVRVQSSSIISSSTIIR